MTQTVDPKLLLNSCRVQAGRFAVNPLFDTRLDSQEKVVRLMAALRSRWQWLATRMATGGWPAANTDLKLGFIRTCPPFGVKPPDDPLLHKRLRTCHRSLVCPFCYAREYAINAYDRLAPVAMAAGRSVLAFERAYAVPASASLPAAVAIAAKYIRSYERRREVDGVAGNVGAVVFHRVRLGRKGPPRLRVVRTTLMVVEAGRRAKLPAGDTAVELTPNPTAGDLASLVGRACAYPDEWYKQETKTLLTLLAGLQKARVFAAYGECRRQTATQSESK